jgi:hypothetical protein
MQAAQQTLILRNGDLKRGALFHRRIAGIHAGWIEIQICEATHIVALFAALQPHRERLYLQLRACWQCTRAAQETR